MSRKRVPLNQNECTADFRIGVPFEQNLHSNLEELMGICDRIIFIKDGTVSGEISHDESPSSIQDLI